MELSHQKDLLDQCFRLLLDPWDPSHLLHRSDRFHQVVLLVL